MVKGTWQSKEVFIEEAFRTLDKGEEVVGVVNMGKDLYKLPNGDYTNRFELKEWLNYYYDKFHPKWIHREWLNVDPLFRENMELNFKLYLLRLEQQSKKTALKKMLYKIKNIFKKS